MVQRYLGQIIPASETGSNLAERLNQFDSAHKTNQAGTSRPANIAPGGIWSRQEGGGYRLMMFDGAADVPIRPVISGGSGVSVTHPGGEPNVALDNTVARRNAPNAFAQPITVAGQIMVQTNGAAHYWFATAAGLAHALIYAAPGSGVLYLRSYTPDRSAFAEVKVRSDGVLEAPAFSGDGSRLTGLPVVGVGQTWADVTATRSVGTVYQNTTGKPIMVAICSNSGIEEVSPNGSTGWVRVGEPVVDSRKFQSFIVPDGHRYRCRGASNIQGWSELR